MTIGVVLLAITDRHRRLCRRPGLRGCRAAAAALGADRCRLLRSSASSLLAAGLLFGEALNDAFGDAASYLAGFGLLAIGLKAIWDVVTGEQVEEIEALDDPPAAQRPTRPDRRHGLAGQACHRHLAGGGGSLARLAVLIYVAILCFFATLAGLSVGSRLGSRLGAAAHGLAGGVFVLLGAVIIYQALTGGQRLLSRWAGLARVTVHEGAAWTDRPARNSSWSSVASVLHGCCWQFGVARTDAARSLARRPVRVRRRLGPSCTEVAAGACAEPGAQATTPEQQLADMYAPIVMLKRQERPCDRNGEAYLPAPVEVVFDDPQVALVRAAGRSVSTTT